MLFCGVVWCGDDIYMFCGSDAVYHLWWSNSDFVYCLAIESCMCCFVVWSMCVVCGGCANVLTCMCCSVLAACTQCFAWYYGDICVLWCAMWVYVCLLLVAMWIIYCCGWWQ